MALGELADTTLRREERTGPHGKLTSGVACHRLR